MFRLRLQSGDDFRDDVLEERIGVVAKKDSFVALDVGDVVGQFDFAEVKTV